MKATGLVRQMDQLGRIVIPMEFRKTMGFEAGSLYEIYITDNKEIILKLYEKQCQECGSIKADQLITKGNLILCNKCITELYSKIK